MFIYSTRCDDVTFSGHLRVTQRQKESSWILSTLNFRKVRDTRFSSWKTKLRSGRILRYMACRGIWVGICRWTTGHCFFTSLYYRVYKFVLVCQQGIAHGCAIDLIRKMIFVCIECFHMTSRQPFWCPKTMKRRPYWCPKPILWELNSFLMQTLFFVPINLHRCWWREWKHSIDIQNRLF